MLYIVDIKAIRAGFVVRMLGQVVEAITNKGLNLPDSAQGRYPSKLQIDVLDHCD